MGGGGGIKVGFSHLRQGVRDAWEPGRWCDDTPVGFSPVSPPPLCTPGSTWTPSMKARGNSRTLNGKALCNPRDQDNISSLNDIQQHGLCTRSILAPASSTYTRN